MSMNIGNQFSGQFHVDWSKILYRLTDAMMCRGIHTRQARDGVAYTWNDFFEWYGYEHRRKSSSIRVGLCQPSLARWRAARPFDFYEKGGL